MAHEPVKRPAFQFYPADWRKDVQLRSCSLAARGLWMDLICVMHECEPYGHLTTNGKPMTPEQIVNQIGGNVATVRKLLAELVENGVARQTETGIIYNKRMVHDEQVRNARASGGKAGAEHGIKGAEHGKKGAVHGIKGGRPTQDKGGVIDEENPPLLFPKTPPPSSSSSSSSSNTPLTPKGDDARFDAFWHVYPRKVGKDAARKAFEKRKPDDDLLRIMIGAVKRQSKLPSWTKDGGQFIPHPSTWLNEGRWMDDEGTALVDADDWTRTAA